jgi:hypothetical protein
MCRQAGFFNGGQTALRPVFFAKPVLVLTFLYYASYYILSLSNERFTFTETRLCVSWRTGTLLRHDAALETDAVAVGKCGPNQRLSECPTEDGSRCSVATLSSLHIYVCFA